jgi:transcriptional regulator with XRE-family HTH domain
MNRIKEILKEKELDQKDLAQKLNVTAPVISRMINGNPTLDNLIKIADAIGVSIAELFEDKNLKHINCPNCGHEIKIEVK